MHTIFFALMTLGSAVLLSRPLGQYLHWAMDPGEKAGPRRRALDGLFLRVAGAGAARGQTWKPYLRSLLGFNAVMFAWCWAVLAMQQDLPLNPDGKGPLELSLIFNTVASFTTNTNLQHYSGEAVMSYASQLLALMWLQFVSASTGLAAVTALARGLAGRKDMGNFLLDLQRAAFLVLLPLATIDALLLVAGGTPMTLEGAAQVTTVEGLTQTVARGPVAAFVAIKQLGTNGGGFFGPNSTHPLENPNFFTNTVALVSLILIPMATVWMYGQIVGKPRHAAVIFSVMLTLLVLKTGLALAAEANPTTALEGLPVMAGEVNLEGKELRLGAGTGALWGAWTTCTSNGSVNAMQNSFHPLTGLVALTGMWLNATFGGVGVGMINMFIYILTAVFLAGLMVGRTPEYLGRKIEPREMTLTVITLILHPLLILGGTALFAATPWGMDTVLNAGPRGFTEILYEFTSAAANNGSGYEGLGDNTPPWNVATGLVMLLARYLPIALPLAIAGSLAGKKPLAEGAGTLGTEGPTFGLMTLATVISIGGLTFFPVALLGPLAEHLSLLPK